MTRGLLRSTSVVGGMTLVSRVLGFVRDMVFARIFGAGAGMDVFVVAFQIPNFLRRLFAEGAFSQAFVPVFSEYHSSKSPEDVQILANRVAGTLGVVLFVVTIIGVLASPALIFLFSSGFAEQPGKFELASQLLRITFPYLFFISLTALAGGILNTLGRFGPPAFTPVLLNVCLIGAAIWVAPLFDDAIVGLAWGVFVAGAAQLAFQIPFLKRAGVLPVPRWGWKDSGVRKIFRLMLPAMFGSSVAQINLIVDRHIASYLVTGSISWLYYSDRLMEFPLGVFAIALATVILPGLSRNHTQGNREQFSATLDWALRLVAVFALPSAVGLLTLAGPMLATLFQHGEFSVSDTLMASYSLMAYSLGLLGFVLVKVLAPGYFARQDTKGPVRIGIIAMLVNVVLNFAIVVPWVIYGLPAPHAGLAIATSFSAVLNAALLYRGLRKQDVYRPGGGWPRLLLQVTIANVVLGVALWLTAGPLDLWSGLASHVRVTRLGALVLGGAALYALMLFIVGLRPRHLLVTQAGPAS